MLSCVASGLLAVILQVTDVHHAKRIVLESAGVCVATDVLLMAVLCISATAVVLSTR